MIAYDIDWETDGHRVKLPKAVLIPEYIAAEYLEMDAEAPGCADEILTDYLSDRYGWLINSFRIDEEGEYLPPENDKESKKKGKKKDDSLIK